MSKKQRQEQNRSLMIANQTKLPPLTLINMLGMLKPSLMTTSCCLGIWNSKTAPFDLKIGGKPLLILNYVPAKEQLKKSPFAHSNNIKPEVVLPSILWNNTAQGSDCLGLNLAFPTPNWAILFAAASSACLVYHIQKLDPKPKPSSNAIQGSEHMLLEI